MSGRIVITGVGLLGPAGIGLDPLRELLATGDAPRREITSWAHRDEAVQRAALVPDVDLSPWVKPRKARRMSRSSLLAVIAAKLACEDGKLAVGGEDDAVCVATSFGPADYTEQILKTMMDEDPESVLPFHFSECVANVGAAQVAIDRKAHGPNLTVTAREAGPALVIDTAVRMMRAGRANRTFALCVDELSPMTHVVLDRMRAVTRHADATPQPFGAHRDGPLAAEGATALILETEGTRPDAPVHAVVRASVSAFDPSAPPRGWGDQPAAMAERVRRGLIRADVDPASIDLVVASAAGTRTGDAYEAAMLDALFEGNAPAITAPKAHIGEWGGGHVAAAILALDGAAIAAPQGTPDATLPVHATALLDASPRRVLVSSIGAGGAAAFVVLEK